MKVITGTQWLQDTGACDMADTVIINPGDTVRHPRFDGVALWFVGYREVNEFDEFDPWQPTIHIDHDTAIVRMVGDDHDYEVAFDELEPVDRDEFCGGCGQIGCGHG